MYIVHYQSQLNVCLAEKKSLQEVSDSPWPMNVKFIGNHEIIAEVVEKPPAWKLTLQPVTQSIYSGPSILRPPMR